MGHARALLGVESPETQFELAERAFKQQWSVRETESAVRKVAGPQGREAEQAGEVAQGIRMCAGSSSPRQTLGAAVSIEHGQKGDRVVIRYNGLDEVEGISPTSSDHKSPRLSRAGVEPYGVPRLECPRPKGGHASTWLACRPPTPPQARHRKRPVVVIDV